MVREILYTITQNTKGVLPATKQWCGMQYENDATNVIFDVSALGNINALYRIDFNTSSNGYNPSENLTCVDGKISRKIPYSVTKQGGEIQITAVITFLDENGTQTGVCYSYPVFAFLTAVAKGEEMAQEIENNISVIEQSVQNMYSEIQRIGAETEINSSNAVNAAEQTVNAKFALENGAEFVFLGGNASNTSTVELIVDSELSENSSNPIQNKAVANEFKKYTPTTEANNNYVSSSTYSSDKEEYFNDKQQAETERSEIKNKLGEIRDYISEQGTSGNWTYRKWNSGMVECYVSIPHSFVNMSAVGALYNEVLSISLPNGIFKTTPSYAFGNLDLVGSVNVVLWRSTNTTLSVNVNTAISWGSDSYCTISLYVVGTWK